MATLAEMIAAENAKRANKPTGLLAALKNAGQVIDQGLLGGRIGQIPQRAAEMKQGLLRAPADLAQLGSPEMKQTVDAAMAGQGPATNPQQWIDAGMELTGLAPLGGIAAHTVYHGSPHRFDKFDMSKIGTGEGKQQQGVGLYFAEKEAVAQRYADRLADMHGKAEGNLYKVDLPDDAVSRLADYEGSFASNPDSVRQAMMPLLTDDVIHNLRGYYGWENVDDAPMAAIIGALDISNGNSRAAVTELMKGQGIPGIRYLDGNSRGAGGTSNFVLFDDQLPRILETNGQPTGLLPWADEAKKAKKK